MASIGFGLERIGLVAARRWRLAAGVSVLLTLAAIVGIARLEFDDDLRNVFTGSAPSFLAFDSFRTQFTDPELEVLLLVEGPDLGSPAAMSALSDLHFELQLSEGVEDVFSLFSLRASPQSPGEAAPLIAPGEELDQAARRAVRAHPMLGAMTLSQDGEKALFAVTLAEDLHRPRALRDFVPRLGRLAEETLAGTDLRPSLTGFPVVREQIVYFIVRDQLVLTTAGALIGFLVSLLAFRSPVAAVMTVLPPVVAALWLFGGMGLAGVPITVTTNVLPLLVMMLAYTNSMHLTHAWCRRRIQGEDPQAAAFSAIKEIGPATVLTTLTTMIAFLALALADIVLVQNFGLAGMGAVFIGLLAVINLHPLVAITLGPRWRTPERPQTSFLERHAWIAAALVRLALRRAWAVSGLGLALAVSFGALHASVPPEYSFREHLAASHPANAAFLRADEAFGGILPVHVLVPIEEGERPLSQGSLERLRAVHQALSDLGDTGQDFSLWSLVRWAGIRDLGQAQDGLAPFLDQLSSAQSRRLISDDGATVLLTAYVRDQPTWLLRPLIDRIETAAKAAAGDQVIVSGVTEVTARETGRIISNLTLNLGLAVLMALTLIALAFRRLDHGLVSLLPNALPIVATGAALYLAGRGMQFTSVIALTVAYGVAVDDTIHFLNRRRLVARNGRPLSKTLERTGRQVGAVLVLTTLVLTCGLATTGLSALPTVTLFGILCIVTLVMALVSDLILLPALIAGPARRWFASGPGGQGGSLSEATDEPPIPRASSACEARHFRAYAACRFHPFVS